MAIGWFPNNPYSLLEYASKDIWVKCYNKSYDYESYIKVANIRLPDGYMKFYEVPDYFVDEQILEMFTKKEALDSLDDLYTGHTWDFEVLSPYDYVTTDEIISYIESCPDTPF